jgi:DNA repair exonuclease SbcCD ATPase subunit
VRAAYDQAVRKFEDEQTKIRQRISEREVRLLEKQPVPCPVGPCDQDYVDDRATELLTSRRQAEHLAKALNTKFQARATAIANHQACKAEIARLDAVLVEAKGDAVYAKAALQLSQHSEAEKAVGIQEALIEQHIEQIATKEQELANLEHVLARSANARTWVSLLSQVRSVLHRDALPRIVHEAALRRMESGINEMLDTFESPFQVKTSTEDLSYVAYFRNGTVMPAQGLSGGQQVVLSLALRWTLNSLFASQIGMMVLDEPTAGLDARHIDLLEVALRGLGEAARSRGCQVIIITHERRLEGVFDQVIELERIVT